MAVEKPRNSDAAAVALLKWILAGLLLLNGIALVVASKSEGAHHGLLDGFRSDFAVGLLCALAGGLCWAFSHGSIPKQDGEEEWNGTLPEQRNARDQAIAFGALGIMLWVASLTTFVAGCEHLSWSPAGGHVSTPVPPVERHRTLSAEPPAPPRAGTITPRQPAAV